MSTASLNASDLSPEQLKLLGIKTPRKGQFTKEEVRSWALKILASMAALSQGERSRVLTHAARVNNI